MQAVFGSTYYIDTDKIEGAMGYEEQYTDITVSVDAEGNVTVDDYEMPGVKARLDTQAAVNSGLSPHRHRMPTTTERLRAQMMQAL